MSLATQIVAALVQFNGHEFCARDILRKFSDHRPDAVRNELYRLYSDSKIDRRMRYGVYYYRSRK